MNLFTTYFTHALLIIFLSASTWADQNRNHATADNLTATLSALEQSVLGADLENNCVPSLTEIHRAVLVLSPDRYPIAAIESNGRFVNRLFQARVKLREKWSALHQNASINQPDCALSLRTTFRLIRGVEDYLGTIQQIINPDFLKSTKTTRANFIPENALLPEGQAELAQLKSGDIMISRGNALSSAAISRIADSATQFSHMALIYVEENPDDPSDRMVYTVESHIEKGVVLEPAYKWFQDQKLRTVLYRHPDEQLAKRAAQWAVDQVHIKATNRDRIGYDITLDMDNHETVFCSEIVRAAYDFASNHTLLTPQYPSTFKPTNRSMLDEIGIAVERSFMPADIETDPRFVMLGEWRDFARVNDAWRKDAIASKLFQWMQEKGWVVKDKLVPRVLSKTIIGARRLPVAGNLLKNMISDTIDAPAMAVLMAFQFGAKRIEKEVVKAEVNSGDELPWSILRLSTEMDAMLERSPRLQHQLKRMFEGLIIEF